MRNIRLTIEYDGTNYQGWQRQRNTRRTLQEIIEKTLKQILQKKVRLAASGRTDAGVHARAQVAHFKTDAGIACSKLKLALNSLLPDDIVITRVRDTDSKFHARFDAKNKTYRYTILNRKYPTALWRKFAYFIPYKLDIKQMQKAARLLIGRHDFRAFQAAPAKNCRSRAEGGSGSVRTIRRIRVYKMKDFIVIDVQANGFLHKMVRNIVGTLIEIGKGKYSASRIQKILASKNRQLAGPTAPACGLCLVRVGY